MSAHAGNNNVNLVDDILVIIQSPAGKLSLQPARPFIVASDKKYLCLRNGETFP